MKNRSGQVLVHVLVMGAMFLAICSAITTQVLQRRTLQKKTAVREEAYGTLEGVSARAWGCLLDAGYPVAGSCRPSGAQEACVPGGFAAEFVGDYPECRIRLTLER